MYVDFRDIDKECPNDAYSLPQINQLVDTTLRHEMISFMDAYLVYNQIIMHSDKRNPHWFLS